MVARIALAGVVLGLTGLPAQAQTPGIFTNGKIRVTLQGVGQVKFGMTPAQVREAAGISLRPERVGVCRYLVDGPPGSPRRTDFRFANRRLVTVSVHKRGYRTPKNVHRGTSLAELERKYPGMRRSAAIGGGTKHVFTPPGGGDRRFVFIVAGGRVESFRSGPEPAVLLDECF